MNTTNNIVLNFLIISLYKITLNKKIIFSSQHTQVFVLIILFKVSTYLVPTFFYFSPKMKTYS